MTVQEQKIGLCKSDRQQQLYLLSPFSAVEFVLLISSNSCIEERLCQTRFVKSAVWMTLCSLFIVIVCYLLLQSVGKRARRSTITRPLMNSAWICCGTMLVMTRLGTVLLWSWCVCVCVWMHFVCVCVCAYLWLHFVCVCMCLYLCLCACVFVCMCVSVRVLLLLYLCYWYFKNVDIMWTVRTGRMTDLRKT